MRLHHRQSSRSLKDTLDRFYADFDFDARVAHDPIEFPRSYRHPEDQELAGFIAVVFAYGSVPVFKAVVRKLLHGMGPSPRDFIAGFDPRKHRKRFDGIKYRFNKNDDIMALFLVLREAVRRHGSLERLFMLQYHPGADDIKQALSDFVDGLLAVDTTAVYGSNKRPAGFLQFFPSPRGGGAAKRLNLYLRWMVRNRDIDLGIWKEIPANRLIIPLDAHIARIGQCLNLTTRKTPDWKMAAEITDSLRQFDPDDPLKYDFALCHQGISRICGKDRCPTCTLFRKDK